MSEKQLAGMVRRRSRAEVDRLVAEYEASGLSRQEFSAKHGLALATLDRYRKRRQRREGAVDNRFVRVELSGARQADGHDSSELMVLLSSARRIEVKRGFDAELLAQLIRVLEQV